tara:strand:- start:284 stop:670 length:387 start_codon:yes stop_codon:yes gene_type:complete
MNKKLNIKFVELTIEKWNALGICETFWIIKSKTGCKTGYFPTFDDLCDKDADHFLKYKNCYYLKGEPCYNEGCDCMLEEETKDCVIDSISIYNNIKNIIYLRKDLIKEISILKLENEFFRSINSGKYF